MEFKKEIFREGIDFFQHRTTCIYIDWAYSALLL